MLAFKHHVFIKMMVILIIMMTLISLIVCLIKHTSLATTGLVTLIVLGATIIGSILGWLIVWSVSKIFRHHQIDNNILHNIEKINEEPPEIMEGIQLEYEVTPENIIAYQIYNQESSPKLGRLTKVLRWGMLISVFLEIIAAILIGAFGGEKYIFLISVICFVALVTLVWFIFSPSFFRIAAKADVMRNYTKGTNTLIGKHLLSITLEGVSDTSNMGESKIPWTKLDYIESTDKYLFMKVCGSAPYYSTKASIY
ncbi:MAG: hypothetical protein JW967_06830 [Dehalococcoidales bacterium]|nr:hypothetical protein [Dehalococcoidales bacterium]